ncbi:hypothetical protein [Pseudomonas sp. A-R-19]|uniref:hypothetical protein n=1 Tax=Pseudomonas sp. A-R-19 TaxID=2832403 RepID=UPI001CBB2947|nr:hypothetical protein [Pseudomonas sp. A-R-19]
MTSFNPTPIVTACITQFGLDLAGEIRVDLFAGGGGATMGQEMATGKAVDIAINHNPKAISMHKRNHPSAEHYITDVYEVCPRKSTRNRPVAHLHASPECNIICDKCDKSRAHGNHEQCSKQRQAEGIARRAKENQ